MHCQQKKLKPDITTAYRQECISGYCDWQRQIIRSRTINFLSSTKYQVDKYKIMSPTAKLNSFLSSTTVAIMFIFVSQIAPEIAKINWLGSGAITLAAFFSSAGLFRILSLGVRWLMERWDWLCEKILAQSYVHGTWIGWFDGHSNERRYMVEHFVQDLEGLVITGRSYTATREEHGYWESDSTSVDTKKGRLAFTYKFDVRTQPNSLVGIHSSLFERRSARHAPTGYSGLAHDLNDQTRIAVHAIKLSKRLLPWDEALAEAERRFAGNKIQPGTLPVSVTSR